MSTASDYRLAETISAQLAELATIGGEPDGGVTRLAYTREERLAHELFASWASDLGARVTCDSGGNTIAVLADGEPYFLLGSHLDTVAHGGRFDGAAGVVGALAAASLAAPRMALGLRVVAFAAEEGARFGRPTLGSAAAAGLLNADDWGALRDADGATALAAADAVGLDPLALQPWLGDSVACFFEIHIEQGRLLELGAARIGLVDAIAGSVRLRMEFVGRPDHSGATPMTLRADALAAAGATILAAERAASDYRSTVATVGRVEVWPNNVTTIPGTATIWIDIRDVDSEQQRIAAQRIVDAADDAARSRGVSLSVTVLSCQAPVVLDAWPRRLATAACEGLRLPHRVLSSGAGHDAAIIAQRASSALVFIPCVDGVSHAPMEEASTDDIGAAAALVAAVIERAADVMVRYEPSMAPKNADKAGRSAAGA